MWGVEEEKKKSEPFICDLAGSNMSYLTISYIMISRIPPYICKSKSQISEEKPYMI